MVFVEPQRQAGTGEFTFYPNEGITGYTAGSYIDTSIIIADGTQRLQYSLTVANDDWDLYCRGYVVEA